MRNLLAFVLLFAGSVSAKDIPTSPKSYVHNENILTEGGEKALSRQLAAFEKATGHQMVVAAFQSLDGDNLEGYSNKLFKAWKPGDKKRNDGILFALFKGDRKWRVEVGYGFEGDLTDMEAYQIATDAAVPSFRKGDFDGGVLNVVTAIQSRITAPAAPLTIRPLPSASSPSFPWLLVLSLGGVGTVVLFLFIVFKRDPEPEPEVYTEPDYTPYIAPIIIPFTESKRKESKRSYEPPKSSYTPPADTYEPPKSSYSSPSYDPPSSSFGSSDSGFSGGGGDSGGGGSSGSW